MQHFKYLISRRDYLRASLALGVSVEVVKAVAQVEGNRTGFIKGTDRPKILYEAHKFHRHTGGRHTGMPGAETLSYAKWTKDNYKSGLGEYERLEAAIALEDGQPHAALKSTSWGMFQILGENFAAAGHGDVVTFVNWMATGERFQLEAFVNFLISNDLHLALRSQDWASFAREYNGQLYAQNKYDTKLQSAFRTEMRKAEARQTGEELNLDRMDAANLQGALNDALGLSLTPDGWIGARSISAIKRFQTEHGLPVTGKVSRKLFEALGLDPSDYETEEQ